MDDTVEAIEHIEELKHCPHQQRRHQFPVPTILHTVQCQPFTLIDILGENNDGREATLDKLTGNERLAEEERLRSDADTGRRVRHQTTWLGASASGRASAAIESVATTSITAASGLLRGRLLAAGSTEPTEYGVNGVHGLSSTEVYRRGMGVGCEHGRPR